LAACQKPRLFDAGHDPRIWEGGDGQGSIGTAKFDEFDDVAVRIAPVSGAYSAHRDGFALEHHSELFGARALAGQILDLEREMAVAWVGYQAPSVQIAAAGL
jgi:hypothetical protein